MALLMRYSDNVMLRVPSSLSGNCSETFWKWFDPDIFVPIEKEFIGCTQVSVGSVSIRNPGPLRVERSGKCRYFIRWDWKDSEGLMIDGIIPYSYFNQSSKYLIIGKGIILLDNHDIRLKLRNKTSLLGRLLDSVEIIDFS
jgi:hypothetical protein